MLILRSRTATFKFKAAADGVSVDPAGNIRIVETVTVTDEKGRETKESQNLAIVSPAEFLYLYHDDSVEMKPIKAVKPPSG